MTKEHYDYIVDHFDLHFTPGWFEDVVISTLYVASVLGTNDKTYEVRFIVESHEYGSVDSWIFEQISSKHLADEIVRYIKETEMLFI